MDIRNFAEVTLDYFTAIALNDIEEYVLKGEPTPINDVVKEWFEWLAEHSNSFTDDTLELVKEQLANDLGAMSIWVENRQFQDDVLSSFKKYFDQNTYFLEFFTTIYLKGLEDDGLR
ncbi:hypothetical protein PU629_20380 [Pullulanibacillus sp. KACC 23026]|uniref:hypothetical protein n=1 Tax=Pullulanibacillus sp. KACC 23026 TaxID=3028315 RepID=UPI0023B0AB7E|nr:hypothetical protein [Pullulanibacillus sp. KACC 23026]WEG12426.1 hypothetical protein PU629_20380 [Pullulanibacillus sp. KACC 23026]